VQTIQENLQFIKENLSIASIVISLLALLATWGNFLNSKKAFLANNYPKIKADLHFLSLDHLPVYKIYNESDKITANDIEIKISIMKWSEFKVFKGKWFTYTSVKLARLKPLESFVPAGLSSDDLIKWLKDRGHEYEPPLSIEDQKILSHISQDKSYKIRLDVNFTSNIFGANKICNISKKYKLVSCSRENTADPKDTFYWRLKTY
jgi:hypothetical protein